MVDRGREGAAETTPAALLKARSVARIRRSIRSSSKYTAIWVERTGGKQVRHETEPGTTRWQGEAVRLLSLLPIEWLL